MRVSDRVKGAATSPGRGVKLSSRARRGPVEDALELALADCGPVTGEARVWAALARRTARLVDLAWRADDVSAVLRGSNQLRELVDLLPLRAPGPAPADDEGGDDDGGSPRGQVLELLDRAPSVGD